MLFTIIEVVSCENPRCKDFARIAPNPHRLKSYYCPVCSKVSSVRVVDVKVAESIELYKSYLLERTDFADETVDKSASARAYSHH